MINYVACLYFQEYLSQIAVRVALICWGLKCIEVAFVLLTQTPGVRIQNNLKLFSWAVLRGKVLLRTLKGS